MLNNRSSVSKALLCLISLQLVMSCQPAPTTGPGLPGAPGQASPDFRILDWPYPTGGDATGALTDFSASLSYSGAKHHPGNATVDLASAAQGYGQAPRYDLLIDGYKLDAQGKQIATHARLLTSGTSWKPDQGDGISQSDNFSLLAELESTDGVIFQVTGGTGHGGYMYGAPDGIDHGNMGYGCHLGENGSYSFDDLSGTVTLFENTKTFHASISFSQAEGLAEHWLSPWQCSYTCGVEGGAYNSVCQESLRVSGSVSLNGDVGFTGPAHLDVKAIPEIISPANQDEHFNYSYVYPRDAAYGQLFRYFFPPYAGEPQIFETPSGAPWYGKLDANTFYPDGAYPFEVESDRYQKRTKTIKVDNTPPIVGEPRIVSRYGRKAVDLIIEDPEVNGVRAGLDRGQMIAWISSDRLSKGRWNVAQVNLDPNRVLLSATFFPNPGQDDSGSYDESFIVRSYDKVYNYQTETSRSFDFGAEPEAQETPLPSPTPSSPCEDSPLLLPEAIQPLIDDVMQVEPVAPEVLNKYRQYTQQMQTTANQLREEGVNVPDPAPVVQASSPPGFATQQVAEAAGFHVASSNPSGNPFYDPSGIPSGGSGGGYSRKVERLLSKYNQLRYDQNRYRSDVLGNLQRMDSTLYQLLLESTEAYGAEYIPEEPEEGASFEDYKFLINELHETFLEHVANSNTYSLLDASQTLANLSLMHDHLLRAMLLEQLPIGNLPTDSSQIDYFSNHLEEITQPWQLVNFTANRIKGFRQRLWNRFYPLKQEMAQLQQEAEHLSYELDALDKELNELSQKAEQLGIEIPVESTGFTSQSIREDNGFKTQMAATLVRIGLPILAAATTFVLTNAPRATEMLGKALGIARGAQRAITQSQRRTASLEQELSDPSLTQEERLAKEAQLAQIQQNESEMRGVAAMAKKKEKEAGEKSKSAGKQAESLQQDCGPACEELDKFARKHGLNPKSPKTKRLFENKDLSATKYIDKFRKAEVRQEFPGDYLSKTVHECLNAAGKLGSKLRKLLNDGRWEK